MNAINIVSKPCGVEKNTRIKVYKTLAKPVLNYAFETRTICTFDKDHTVCKGIKFYRRIIGYFKLDMMENMIIIVAN